MYATNYLETGFLNAMRGTTLVAPSTLYVGLYISDPTETGVGGTEISYAGYSRRSIVFEAPAAMNGGIGTKNTQQIDFTESPTDAGTVTHIGILDSLSGGNMLLYGKLTEDLTVSAGEAPVLLAGEVVYYLTGNLSVAYKTRLLGLLRGQNIPGFTPCLALYNGNPESSGGELTGDNYTRVQLTMGAPTQTESGQAQMVNVNAVNFPRPSTDWGRWNYTAIYDAAAAGQPVWIVEKTPPKEIKRGYMPKVSAGDVRVGIN